MAESRNRVRIDPEQIPQRAKDDFGYRLFLGYREAMKDPENAKKFRELGLACEARRARQRAEEERAAAENASATVWALSEKEKEIIRSLGQP